MQNVNECLDRFDAKHKATLSKYEQFVLELRKYSDIIEKTLAI